jgi:hypothetical protein
MKQNMNEKRNKANGKKECVSTRGRRRINALVHGEKAIRT